MSPVHFGQGLYTLLSLLFICTDPAESQAEQQAGEEEMTLHCELESLES